MKLFLFSMINLLLCVLFVEVICAAEINYSAAFEIAYYENINQEFDPQSEEESRSFIGELSILENTLDLFAGISMRLQAIDYKNDIANDTTRGYANGNAIWVISPSRMDWELSTVYTQTTIDLLEGDVPDNQQDATAFSTGPGFRWNFSRRNYLLVEPRIQVFSYDDSAQDNRRVTNDLSWIHGVSASLTISLNHDIEVVDYDQDISNSDYTENDVYLELDYSRGLNQFELLAGYAKVSSDSLEEIDSSRYRFSFQNQRNRTSSIQLEFEKDLTDTSNTIIQQAGVDAEPGLRVASSDVFIETNSRMVYEYRSSASLLDFELYRAQEEHAVQSIFDQEIKGALINNIWMLARGSQLEIEARYEDTAFVNTIPFRSDIDIAYRMNYEYRLRRNFIWNMEFQLLDRDSSLEQECFEEKIFMLSLIYTTS